MQNISIQYNKLMLGLAFLILVFSSCRSAKDLTLMNDARNNGLTPRALPYTNYKLKVNDNLYISVVSSNPDMNEIYNPATVGKGNTSSSNSNIWGTLPSQFVNGYIIDQQGYLTLPGIGKVNVLGLTIEQCEKEIQTRENQYLKDVTVKVRLLNYKVTVIGDVVNPGVYYNYNPEFTVFDALSMANGIKNTSAIHNVLVLREFGDQTQTYRLDLNSVSALKSEGYNLLPNDVLIVQPAKNKNLELRLPYFTITFATITNFLLILSYIRNY